MGTDTQLETGGGDSGLARDARSAPGAGPGVQVPTPGGTSAAALARAGNGHQEGEGLATALGWFSIGLGLAQLTAPRGMARLVGASGDDTSQALMRALGLREIATGIGVLARPRPAGWLWARVAGDVMDLALLGATSRSDSGQRGRTAAAAAAVLGVAALDVLCGQQLTRGGEAAGEKPAEGIRVRKSITVNRSPEEVYRFWHDFENLPRFMSHLEAVQVTGERRSHWKARAPAGTSVEWDAETVEDRPNELIAWRSVADAGVENAGSVRFAAAPGRRGTEVTVELQYAPPGGKIGAAIAKLFGEEPSQQVDGDLRRFKQVMETGEVVHSDASVHRGPHAAQPAEESVTA